MISMGESFGNSWFASALGRLTAALLAVGIPTGHAGAVADVLGIGGDSGRLAKLEFRLRDGFPVTSVAWSPDGRYLASSNTQGNLIHIWDMKRRVRLKEVELAGANPNFHTLAWSPDAKFLAACGPNKLHVYRVSDWSQPRIFAGDEAAGCVSAAFSSDGREMALLGKRLRVYATANWDTLRQSDFKEGWGRGLLLNAITYLPRNHTLVIGGGQLEKFNHEGRVHDSFAGYLWLLGPTDTAPSRTLRVFDTAPQGGADVISVAANPDGRYVAAGTNTGEGNADSGIVTQSVHVVSLADDTRTGTPLDGLHFGPPTGLAYTPDGRYLIVGHRDEDTRAIHLIQAKSSRVVDVVHAGGTVYDLTVDPQGMRFAAGNGRQILVWSLPTER